MLCNVDGIVSAIGKAKSIGTKQFVRLYLGASQGSFFLE